MNIRYWVICFSISIGLAFTGAATAQELTDYKQDVKELKQRLDTAVQKYSSGEDIEARRILQAAYLEIFEGLEPAIRSYVSAKTNLEMEKELSVRLPKIIKKKVDAKEFAQRVAAFKVRLDEVLPKIQGKVSLQAHIQAENAVADAIAAEWQQAFDQIEEGLADALRTFREQKNAAAAKMVKDVQFKFYKNSELETALRRFKSAAVAAGINGQFSDLINAMKEAKPLNEVAYAISVLVADLREQLPNLPVTEKKSAAAPR